MSEPEKLSDVGLRLLEKWKSPDPDFDRRLAEYEQREAERREVEAKRFEDRVERLRGIPLGRHPNLEPEPWEGGLLHGSAGIGKTRRAIARLLSVPRSAGVFMGFMEYLDLSRRIEFDRASDFDRERADAAFDRRYLVLDDFGARRPTDFAIDCAYALIDARWNRQLETLVTSNLAPDAISEQWDQRIASRILGFGRAERMGGQDWRLR